VRGKYHAPAALPPGKTRLLGETQGRSGREWKISPPPGFDPRTVQPVVSRYTDWAAGPHNYFLVIINPICFKARSQNREMRHLISSLSFRSTARKNSTPTGMIFMKFDIDYF
jgi:hypothetical protein